MKLYLVRHGETENNRAHYFSGWSQTPLTEKGLADAVAAGERLKDIPYDKIYSSDLYRAVQTCKAAFPGKEFEPCEMLREVNLGSLTDHGYDEILPQLTEEEKARRLFLDYTLWGGENRYDLRARGRKFLTMLEGTEHETVIAFSHEFFIKYLLEELLGRELGYREYRIRNGAVCVFEYKDGVWNMTDWDVV